MRRMLLAFAVLLFPLSSAATESNGAAADYVRRQVPRCWNVPAHAAGAGQSVTIRFRLDRHGAVEGAPQVIAGAKGEHGEVLAQSAIRAILRCSPYAELPNLAPYDAWREITITFAASRF